MPASSASKRSVSLTRLPPRSKRLIRNATHTRSLWNYWNDKTECWVRQTCQIQESYHFTFPPCRLPLSLSSLLRLVCFAVALLSICILPVRSGSCQERGTHTSVSISKRSAIHSLSSGYGGDREDENSNHMCYDRGWTGKNLLTMETKKIVPTGDHGE